MFQLLGSVGKYIKSNKAGAHPDSINLLNSIYASLEKVMPSGGMTEAGRKRELLEQVTKFKQLKEQIGATKGAASRKSGPSSQSMAATLKREQPQGAGLQEERRQGEEKARQGVGSDMSHMTPHEAFAFALEEIKEVIKAEFKALRAELKLWRDRT